MGEKKGEVKKTAQNKNMALALSSTNIFHNSL